jgi:VWFA-related protein
MTRAVAALVLMALAAVPQGQQAQAPRFRSNADAVRVDVQVRQGGRPVTGLAAADFELRDAGVAQRIEAISIEDVPVSLMLLLDTSNSVAGPLLQQLKAAAHAAIRALRAEDQAALLTFSHQVERASSFSSDLATLGAAIDRMQPLGQTALRDAIFSATALRERASGRAILLVFTDGHDTASWLDSALVVNAALHTDMVVYGVSSGGELPYSKSFYDAEPELFSGPFLEDVAERTGGELLQVKEGKDLAQTFARIVSDFKSRYLLTYSPRNVAASGWHPLEVRLKRGRGTVTARRGYYR